MKRLRSLGFLAVASLFITTNGFADVPRGKGTLTIVGAIGAGQENTFTIRQCRPNVQFGQDRLSCVKMPFQLKTNDPVLLDAGVYSIHGPQNSFVGSQTLAVQVYDGQEVQVPLKPINIPPSDGIRYRVFLDLTNPQEFRKMAVGVWSAAENASYMSMSCSQLNGFSQYICECWTSADYMDYAMMQTDDKSNYYFIHPDALADAGWHYQMSNLGPVFVNQLSDTGTTVGVFPGSYGIRYYYEDGHTADVLGQITVN